MISLRSFNVDVLFLFLHTTSIYCIQLHRKNIVVPRGWKAIYGCMENKLRCQHNSVPCVCVINVPELQFCVSLNGLNVRTLGFDVRCPRELGPSQAMGFIRTRLGKAHRHGRCYDMFHCHVWLPQGIGEKNLLAAFDWARLDLMPTRWGAWSTGRFRW